MDGIIALVVLLILLVFGIPIIIAGNLSSKINALSNEVSALKGFLNKILSGIGEIQEKQDSPSSLNNNDMAALLEKLQQLESKLQGHTPPDVPATESTEAVSLPQAVTEQETVTEEALPVPEIINSTEEEAIQETTGAAPQEVAEEVVEERVAETYLSYAENPVSPTASPDPVIPTVHTPKAKTNFEQFIGEKLISIVGITILVLGIFFSVKWAIDRNLISDAGKVLIGVASGTILIAIAHRLAKNYRAFSSILVGGGIAVLYFSIYEAYQAYHLIDQTVAFAIMVVITLLAVILSIVYDKKELAIIGIVGGFCTPFFVSNGSGDYKTLFSYLLILNIGMFLLAHFKKWNLVNIICYVLTLLIFGGWATAKATAADAGSAFLFTILFYLVFFGMHTIFNLRHRKAFGYIEIIMLLSNSFVCLGFGLYFLHFIRDGQFQGLFTLALATFNCIFAYIFYRRNNIDRNFIFLLIGLTLTFLSLTAPLQLDGNYITLFWACELVLMYWLGQKTGIVLLKNASPLLLGLTLGSLIRDWHHDYYGMSINRLPVVFNKAFITAAVVIAALAIMRKLVRRDEGSKIAWNMLAIRDYYWFLSRLLVLFLYIGMFLEVSYQSFGWTQITHFRALSLCTYHFAFMLGLSLFLVRTKEHESARISLGVLAVSMLLYMLPGNSATANLRDYALISGRFDLYYSHYLLTLLVLAASVLMIRYVNRNYRKDSLVFTMISWLLSIVLVFLVSAETIHIWLISNHQPGFSTAETMKKAYKVAFPIIWGICSLTLMLLGMRYRVKTWRIISLSLFLVTILKLFFYDISNVGQGGKIAAFIILGIILLVVSFMYQKIKGLFRDDDKNDTPEA